MDTNLFRYVIAAAESGSLSAAARSLYISQPALTKQISKLEQQLGQKLFDRTRNSFSITPAGILFTDYARKIVALEDQLLNELEVQNGIQKDVHIATTHRGGYHTARYTGAFYKAYPDIVPNFHSRSSLECENALLNEQMELAVYTSPVLSPGLEYRELCVDPLFLIVPTQYVPFTPEELEMSRQGKAVSLPVSRIRNPSFLWLVAREDQGLYRAEQNLFQQIGFSPRQSQCVDYVNTRYYMSTQGNGIALFPRTTLNYVDLQSGQAALCTLEGIDMHRSVVIARKKGKKLSEAANIYWDFLIAQFDGRQNEITIC